MYAHRSQTLVGWIAGLLVLTAGLTARADERVLIRSYNMAGVSPETLARAQTTAAQILHEASLTVEWRDCSSMACQEPIGPGELVIRIVAAPASTAARTLGCSLVDLNGGAGTLGTVFADHVAVVAARAEVDRGTLLGRAVAHEVGHMLIGTSGHAASGLMRARWLDRELRRDAAADWTWSNAEVLEMQRHLNARLREPNVAAGLVVAMLNAAPVLPAPTTCHVGRCVSK